MNEPLPSGAAPKTRGRVIHWARLYDWGNRWLTFGRDRAIRELVLELAQLKPGDQVLDVGCGPGSLAVAAKAKVGSAGAVSGIDASPEMIAAACRKAARLGVDVAFRVGLIEAIPFPNAQFDVVLSTFMLHHLPEDLKRKGIAEIHRVLKPGGRFLGVDFQPSAYSVTRVLTRSLFGHHMMESDLGKLEPLMRETGFATVEVGTTRYRTVGFARGTRGEGTLASGNSRL
ncbi:MAG: class I SAM-dependent methyltransferase [Candidatus Binatia bacterium]